jgi:anaerobic dimethyl sulfoxide reductase subunit C (anchor subunit)
MNAGELPMILFTVLAQMSVGAFVVLGVVHLVARLRGYSAQEVDALSDPAVYAVGVTLVLGLAASALHMHDVFNVLNVFRHLDGSWLSREVALGMLFAGCGFVFAACQWFGWGSATARSALAMLTALIGVVFVAAMSMVYYTLVTVPAWHTWNTPVRFYTTALLLGGLAVGTAFMTRVMLGRDDDTGWGRHSDAIDPARMRTLILGTLTAIAVLEVVLVGLIFVVTPVHIANLYASGPVGAASAHALTGPWYITRLVLVFVGAGLLTLFLFRLTAHQQRSPKPLALLVTIAFGCVFIAELLGRAAFYESMTRVGM